MKRRIGPVQIGWVLLLIALAALIGLVLRTLEIDRDLTRALIALEEGNAAVASENLGKVLQRQPWREDLWETAGRAALSTGDPGLAIDRLLEAEMAGVITAEGYLALGDAYQQQGQTDSAVENWHLALPDAVDPIPIHYRLLEVHRGQGDYASAVADLQALASLDPNNALTHYQLGLTLAAQEPQAALASLLRASTLDSGLQDAVRLLEKSLQPDPEIEDPAFTFFNAGRALAALGEWPLAAEAFRQALVVNPGYAEAWAFLGEAMFKIDQDGSAMMETALEVNPNSLTANLLLALQLRRGGQASLAIPYLERAAVIAPDAPAVAAETAQTYADLGKVNEALDFFVRAAELAPEDPTYLHLLAMYSINNELQVDEIGLPAARAAVLRNPEDPVALDLIGYAYYLKGDRVSGLRFLYRALSANPNYAPARLHLGMLYIIQEEELAAREQFELAIQLAPGSGAAEQAKTFMQLYFP